jgi:hypothetical protein
MARLDFWWRRGRVDLSLKQNFSVSLAIFFVFGSLCTYNPHNNELIFGTSQFIYVITPETKLELVYHPHIFPKYMS